MATVTLLGTGDPLNPERAQTSLALPCTPTDFLLLDASSGTVLLRQLAQAKIPLARIRHLVLSHRHFDHIGGLAPLLVALVPDQEASITVAALPETVAAARQLLHLTIPGVEEWLGERLHWQTLHLEHPYQCGDLCLTPFAVDHGLECCGSHIEHAGKTVVFAADTRPTATVQQWARDADLLIHEAYGLAAEATLAHRFGHTTAAEAGQIAAVAGARRLLLTHLRAARFADPAALATEAGIAFGEPVQTAIDLQQVSY